MKKPKRKKSKLNLDHLVSLTDIEEIYHLLTLIDEKTKEKVLQTYQEKIAGSKASLPLNLINSIQTAKNTSEWEDNVKNEIIVVYKKNLQEYARKVRKMKKSMAEAMLIKLKARLDLFSLTKVKKDFYAVKKAMHALEQELLAKN